MREKVAIRLHTRERNLLKIVYESSPLNVSWEELTENQREKFRKDADQILTLICEEIKTVENPIRELQGYARDGIINFNEGFHYAKSEILALLKEK